MSAKTKSFSLFLLCVMIFTIDIWLYYQSPNSFLGSVAFIVGATSGSGASFFILCFIILSISGYEHQAERARVTELNRHAGIWTSLLGKQTSLYLRTRGNHSPEAEAEWDAMNKQFRAEERRHKQVNAPIMERHQQSELFRGCIFILLFIGMIGFACYGMFAFP